MQRLPASASPDFCKGRTARMKSFAPVSLVLVPPCPYLPLFPNEQSLLG